MSAHAAEPKLAALTRAYADKHNLPVRVVKNDLGTRQVERHFVPVLPTTHDDFLQHFNIANGAVVWRVNGSDSNHPVLAVSPGYVISYIERRADNGIMPHATGGRYLTLALDRAQMHHWEAFIDRYTPAGGRPFSAGLDDGATAFKAQNPGCRVHCMWWLVHAETATDQNLAHLMGVRRGRGAEVLLPRLVHAGNERVGPIGVPVATVEQFNAMTDQQLLGPEPAGGAAEQVK